MNTQTPRNITAVELVAEERHRQINKKGWTARHDQRYHAGTQELAMAGAVYALDLGFIHQHIPSFLFNVMWPWDKDAYKVHPNRVRTLVKAAALICAQIDLERGVDGQSIGDNPLFSLNDPGPREGALRMQVDALSADRKKLEAEVARLKAIVDSRDAHPFTATEAQARAAMVHHGAQLFRPASIGEDEAHDLNQDAIRAANRRELEMTAHDREELIVARRQVASLQGKLEAADGAIKVQDAQIRDLAYKLEVSDRELDIHKKAVPIYERDISTLRASLEGSNSRALREAEECAANKRRLDMVNGLLKEIREAVEGGTEKSTTYWYLRSKVLCGMKPDDALYPSCSNTRDFKHALQLLGHEILEINKNNGWEVMQPHEWPTDGNVHFIRKIGTCLALIHSEVSEALEAVRKLDRTNFEEELADIVIRVLDTSHGLGINLGNVIEAKLTKNRGRGHKHGGKSI